MKQLADLPLFRTPVEVNPPLRPIEVGDRNVFLGSCFAEHVGRCFQENRLNAVVNPLGVQYNPKSIARLLTTEVTDPQCDYVQHDGMWHTWLGDSSLSNELLEACRLRTESSLCLLREALQEADNLFLTFGTNHCYSYSATATPVVANCHKLPQKEFTEEVITVDRMAEVLNEALVPLHVSNPKLQVVMTVSPYRYQKYGFHENQLSKGRLLSTVADLCSLHPNWITYFPAYEIMLDELRDYRFYAEDMLHPSQQAVQYIWQRMHEAWFSPDARTYLQRWEKISRMMNHQSLHPDSPSDVWFRQQVQDELERLKKDYPIIEI